MAENLAIEEWRRTLARALRKYEKPDRRCLSLGNVVAIQGWIPFREAVEMIEHRLGVPTGKAQVMLTAVRISKEVRTERINPEKESIRPDPKTDGSEQFLYDETDFLYWLAREARAPQTEKADPTPEPAGRRGRTPEYDWGAFGAELVRRVHHDGVPESNRKMTELMLAWCEQEWGHQPSDSMAREHVSKLLSALRRSR